MTKKEQITSYIENELNSYLEEYKNQGIDLELNKSDFIKREELNSSLKEIKIDDLLDKIEYDKMIHSSWKNTWFVWTKTIWSAKSLPLEDDYSNLSSITSCLGDTEES